RWLLCQGSPELMFTENETNFVRLFGVANHGLYVKDGINDYIIAGKREALNPELFGTKAAARYRLHVQAGQSAEINLRLSRNFDSEPFGDSFDEMFRTRRREADEFYE